MAQVDLGSCALTTRWNKRLRHVTRIRPDAQTPPPKVLQLLWSAQKKKSHIVGRRTMSTSQLNSPVTVYRAPSSRAYGTL